LDNPNSEKLIKTSNVSIKIWDMIDFGKCIDILETNPKFLAIIMTFGNYDRKRFGKT